MSDLSRRGLVRAAAVSAGAAWLGDLPLLGQSPAAGASQPTTHATPRHGAIHQSVSRWCYQHIPLEQLCQAAAQMGLVGIDLLQPEDYEVPARYGLRCTMGYAGGGEINRGLNRVEHHAAIEAGLRKNLPLAAHAGVPNVITFSGLRGDGLSDDQGARNTVAGLKPLARMAEDHGIQLCMELLNSKVDHPGYMADHTAWGVQVLEEVASPNVKLLYDIYHMQIMEGDLIATIRKH
ncbi:MAG TPA: TIM barrel protein, partial [Acidobacteriaceae bacterium]